MKKLLFFTLFCLIGQILYSQKLTLTKATKEVTIDGAIGATDPWGSTWITASKAKGTTTGMSAKFQLTYDNDNLYFVAIVEDATRNTSCDSTWLNDCIEIFIAMDTTSGANGTYKKGDFQFRKRANDSLPVDGSSVLQIVTAKVLDNGISYTQEWAIPWKKMADIMDPAWDGKNFKFDVAFADATKPGERTQQQFWDNNSDSQWNNTTKFGWIKLLTPVLLLKSQSITFNDIPKILAGTADMTIPAFSSSGLALSYTSSNPNVVSIINGKLHVVAVGSCIITATQAGNAEFYAATAATRTVVVTTTNNVTPALTISKASKAPTIDAVVNANDPWGFN